MVFPSTSIILTWLSGIAVVAIVILLQIFLSKRQNRWVGLVLPVMGVLYSISMMVCVTIFSFDTVQQVFFQMLLVFFVCNIPTLVLVVLYAACRSKLEGEIQDDTE